MCGMSRHRAGVLFGVTAPVTMPPALPKEVAVPGARGSSNVTAWPSRCRCSAHDTPTMPAPMTAMRINRRSSRHDQRIHRGDAVADADQRVDVQLRNRLAMVRGE